MYFDIIKDYFVKPKTQGGQVHNFRSWNVLEYVL